MLEDVVSSYESVADTLNPDYISSLNNLAVAYSHLGRFETSLSLGERILRLESELHGIGSPEHAFALGNLAYYNYCMGDVPMAIRMGNQSISNLDTYGKSEDSFFLHFLNNQASFYAKIGNFDRAIYYQEKVLNLFESLLGKENPYYSYTLSNLAGYYNEIDESDKAINTLQEVLLLQEKSIGKVHPSYAISLNQLANCYIDKGDYDNAIHLLNDAIMIQEKTIGINHIDYAKNLSLLSLCYRKQNNYQNSFELCLKAYDIDKQCYPDFHPSLLETMAEVADCYFNIGDSLRTQMFIKNSTYNLVEYVARNFMAINVREHRNLWRDYTCLFNERIPKYALVLKTDSLRMLLYDALLFSKGILLNSERELRRMFSNDEYLNSIYTEWCVNQNLLDSQMKMSQEERTVDTDSLSNIINKQMQYLFDNSTDFSRYVKKLSIKWEEVKVSLDLEEVAIEFFYYDNKYYAAILKCDSSSPSVIEISSDEQIAVVNYDDSLLYDVVWRTLEAELQGVKTIYFAPDRDLHKIAIEYALIDGKQRMSDKYNMVRLSSTRELVERKSAETPQSAVLYGGLKYDLEKDVLIAESRKTGTKQLMASRAVDNEALRYGVSYLKGTEVEVENIERDLKKKGIECVTISGNAGTEESFRALSGKSVDILHLATHGYFWSDEDAERRNYIPFLNSTSNTGMRAEDKAMLRSGLFFSGANVSLRGDELPDDVEDGVLTAMELSNLNLGKVDLVVLSACQSGLGETSGDGVFGLQRGFKLAGAKSLLMSLWKVDDKATQILMTEFYKNLLAGDTKVESLKKAQQFVKSQQGYEDPEYWAGWILLDALN